MWEAYKNEGGCFDWADTPGTLRGALEEVESRLLSSGSRSPRVDGTSF